MARRTERTVSQDPHIDDIHKDIVQGVAYREIARRYGYSPAAISKYVRGKMPNLLQEAEKMKSWTADRIVVEMEQVMASAKKMLAAAEDYLQDPTDPEKFTLEPRAEEMWVIYTDGHDENGRPIRRKELLQTVIDEMAENGKTEANVRVQQADPRKYLLESIDKISEQLERIARVRGEMADVHINIQQNPVWIQLQQTIIEGLRDYPEARETIAERLRTLTLDE